MRAFAAVRRRSASVTILKHIAVVAGVDDATKYQLAPQMQLLTI